MLRQVCLIRVGANLCRDTGPPGSTFPTPGVPDSAVSRQVSSTLSRFVVCRAVVKSTFVESKTSPSPKRFESESRPSPKRFESKSK